MRTLKIAACGAVAALAACSDSPMSPRAAFVAPKPQFAVGDNPGAPGVAVAALTQIIVCKTGDVAGTFNVTRTPIGASGGSVVTSPYVIQPGTCRVVGEDAGPSDVGSNFTVTEVPAPFLTGITGSFIGVDFPVPNILTGPINNPQNGATYFINQFHGILLTFNNDQPEVSGGSITLQGGSFTLQDQTTTGALGGTFRIANTAGGQAVAVTSVTVLSPAVAKIGGGNEASIGISGCSVAPNPFPVVIPQNGTQLFTISGCNLSQPLAAGNELNITVRATLNNGSQPFYLRTYTVKAQ